MEVLKSHYWLPLGLDKAWNVAGVELNAAAKCLTIALEYRRRGRVRLKCKVECEWMNHAPVWAWRCRDTMGFETIVKKRVPRGVVYEKYAF